MLEFVLYNLELDDQGDDQVLGVMDLLIVLPHEGN